MQTRTILIGLFIIIFSLPFVLLFLYSVSALCEMSGCNACGIIGHHIDKWLSFFNNVFISDFQKISLFIIISGFVFILFILKKSYFQQEFLESKFYEKYRLKGSFNSLLLNPIKRVYASAIIDPQIYS